ncbi:ribonuclease H-like domain-containing protein [Tanacetum coccineum]
MDLETTQTTTTAKLLILKQENGNSFKPAAQTTTNADGTSTSLIPGPVTTEEKVQKKNDVKARSMLLMALPNEHLMTFNQYKDAKTLFAAIQTRFGGNEATKKTQKTLLKQMYENFSAPSTESLDSIFNRLQKIVSQLAILGENISQEDLNLKFLRSLPSEWNTHVVVWRNKPDLDTMSFDDLYNNFKIVEQEVKGTASSSSSSSSQNMAFVSSPSSTNEVNTAYGVSTANTQVSPASTQVSTASTQVSTANLSDDTVYAFLASQPNGSQLVYEDLEQIHEDDIEEMDLKWQLALLSMRTRRFFQKTGRKITINGSDTAGYDKSKVECFNCHKMGHFARECRGPRNQDSRYLSHPPEDPALPCKVSFCAVVNSSHLDLSNTLRLNSYSQKTSSSVLQDLLTLIVYYSHLQLKSFSSKSSWMNLLQSHHGQLIDWLVDLQRKDIDDSISQIVNNANTTATKEPPSHIKGRLKNQDCSQATLKIDKGKGIATESDDDPSKKLVKALSIVRPDPDEPVRDKEEQIKKDEEEARLLAITKPEVIKVVQEEAEKIGLDPKAIKGAKAGEMFKKALDAEHDILKRQYTKKVINLLSSKSTSTIAICGLSTTD